MAWGATGAPDVAGSTWREVLEADGRTSASRRPSLLGLAVAVAVAVVFLATGRTVAATTVVLLGTVATQLSALRWPPWLRLIDGIGSLVGHGLRFLALGAVFVVVVVPLWLLGRIVGHDPLAITTRGPRVRPTRATRPFSGERSTASTRRRALSWGGVAVLAALLGGVVLRSTSASPSTSRARRSVSTTHSLIAHQHDPWAPDLFAAEARAGNGFDPYLTMRPDDFQSRYLNVEDGERRSYRHHGNDADDVEVWFFGGSTMFGVGQRDDHTISSEVVRLAEESGIPVRARNFGVSSYVNWQETVLFLELLQQRPTPDLVVFYDGANDATVDMRDGVVHDPSTYFAPDVERALHDEHVFLSPQTARHDDRSELERARDFLGIYGAGVTTARQAAHANGVPIRHFFQPVLGTKRPMDRFDEQAYAVVDGNPEDDQSRWDVIRAQPLPAGVVDLTSTLDAVREPVYFDQIHTNELGAHVVAEAMYAELRPTLERLAATRDP